MAGRLWGAGSLRVESGFSSGSVPLQLPCHKLRQLTSLDLYLVSVQVAEQNSSSSSSSSSSGGLGGSINVDSIPQGVSTAVAGITAPAVVLPSLRQLRLMECHVPQTQLLQLVQPPGLTQLHLLGVRMCDNRWGELDRAESALVIAQLLSKLPSLEELHLWPPHGNICAQVVSPMQQLQPLQLLLTNSNDGAALVALPVSLTALQLGGGAQPVAITAAAQLSRLNNLQQLRTRRVHVHPDVLAGLTWLRHLCLRSPSTEQAATNAAALLTALGRLTQLQHLELWECGLTPSVQQQQQQQQPQQQPEEDAYKCFSALTASTQLTALRLAEMVGPPLPSCTALHHLFPAGRVLPHLRSVRLERHRRPISATDVCVDAAGVSAIARSCPALTELVLKGVTPPDFDTGCLNQLPRGVTVGWGSPSAWLQAFFSEEARGGDHAV